MEAVATRSKELLSMRTTSRQRNMFPDTDGIAGKLQRLIFWNCQPPLRRNPLGNRRSPIPIERSGIIQQLATT